MERSETHLLRTPLSTFTKTNIQTAEPRRASQTLFFSFAVTIKKHAAKVAGSRQGKTKSLPDLLFQSRADCFRGRPAGGETFRALEGGANGQHGAYATSFLSLASVSGEPKKPQINK